MESYSGGTHIVKDLVLESIDAGTPLRISGKSTWIDAGRPVNADRIASLAAHSGVVEYTPGDLTITVKSGTTLGDIERITAEKGQWLPLDPFGSRDGSIGATIATGSFGPLAHAFGRARDLVLGVEFVTGQGKVVRGGGKVVKNVAGFDLVRLITGSWGTLGIITEVTLRLYSRPQDSVTVSLGAADSETALLQRINSILSAPGIPFSVELLDADTASMIGLSEKQQIIVRLGGNSAAVSAQQAALQSLGGVREIDPAALDRLRSIEETVMSDTPDKEPPTVLRLSSLPQHVAHVWNSARSIMSGIAGGAMHATPSLGIVRCIIPPSTPFDIIERMLDWPQTTVIFERLPPTGWRIFSPTVVADGLAQRVKRAFDPDNLLNPGILGPLE